MTSFEFVEHNSLTFGQLKAIIRLKDAVWKYPIASHIAWLRDNLKDGDYHLLLWGNNELVGYLNIVRLSGTLRAWGIGNVVIDPRMQGRNMGLLLMNLADYFLANTNIPGMLICKDHVANFYMKCGWTEFHDNVFLPDGTLLEHHFFTRRMESEYNELKIDRVF